MPRVRRYFIFQVKVDDLQHTLDNLPEGDDAVSVTNTPGKPDYVMLMVKKSRTSLAAKRKLVPKSAYEAATTGRSRRKKKS
jgi:hypothetical protein